jgi:hypothetical protein
MKHLRNILKRLSTIVFLISTLVGFPYQITASQKILNLSARRTSLFDVDTAWYALLNSSDPKQILLNRRLASARQEINAEVERHTHTPPKFSKDGRIAVLKINTGAQVHPVIAKRWVISTPFIYSHLYKISTMPFPWRPEY